MKRTVLGCCLVMLLGATIYGVATQEFASASPPAQQAAQQATTASQPGSPHRATINRYCVTCHNDKLKTADFSLSNVSVENPSADAEAFEKVIHKLRLRAMPPASVPRPDEATYEALAGYLETELDRAAATNPNPGRTTAAHRLNRAEYANAVRDLLALQIDSTSLLPSDDSGGFDNLGALLSVSPTLMERYVSAAGKISRLAVGDPTIKPDVATYTISPYLVQGDRVSEDLPFGSRGGVAISHYFPLDGDYEIKVHLQRSDGAAYVLGLAEPHPVDMRLDGERLKLFTIGGESIGKSDGAGAADSVPPDFKQAQYEKQADEKLTLRFPAKAGSHLVQVAFLKERWAPEGAFNPRSQETYADGNAEHRSITEPKVSNVSVIGPFNPKGAGETASRKKIFVCKPSAAAEEEVCAKKILSTLARGAYRRPVQAADVEPLLGLYKAGRKDGTFESGIEMGVQGLLVSPQFLFRIERDPANLKPDTAYKLSDVELASRLSFFLWSSIPDEELLQVAEKGQLSDPTVLQNQIHRMLTDPKANTLVDNFAGQWLQLRNLKTKTPNRDVFPEFDESLRQAFEQESTLFLKSILKEDRSVMDVLNADYTFVNERLAKFYGIPNVYGSHFRRVQVTDENRRGLLGQGSVLTLTALANRTSPVERGKWVLDNLLNAPPPPPPPNVPALKEKGEKGAADLPMRKQMEEHRKNPACIGCHSRMDPIGFALENFDAIGKWRAIDANAPIDASGVLLDGSQFEGPAGLRKALLKRPEPIVGAFVEKLLTYALGRQVEYYDAPSVRSIVRSTAADNYRWSSIVMQIVKSTPFQMRRSRTS